MPPPARPKIQQTEMLVTCQRLGDFFFIWAGLAVFEFEGEIITKEY